MTEASNAQSAAQFAAVSRSRRLHRLLVVVFTALFGITLTSLSFAAVSPTHQAHPPSSRPAKHATSPRASAHPTTIAPKPKAKHAVASHSTPRKAPAKTRVAAKSKPATRTHQPPKKPTKLATKQIKHAA